MDWCICKQIHPLVKFFLFIKFYHLSFILYKFSTSLSLFLKVYLFSKSYHERNIPVLDDKSCSSIA